MRTRQETPHCVKSRSLHGPRASGLRLPSWTIPTTRPWRTSAQAQSTTFCRTPPADDEDDLAHRPSGAAPHWRAVPGRPRLSAAVLELKDQGFEVALHGASDENSSAGGCSEG